MKKRYRLPRSTRIPQRVLHFMLYSLVLKKTSDGATFPDQHTPIDDMPMKNPSTSPLAGAALCLLKTQFAKKPKNPV